VLPTTVPVRTKALDTVGDAREYDALARSLLLRRAFTRDSLPPYQPELFRTPLYPLLLAPGAALPAGTVVWGLALQSVLSLMLVLLTYRLARTLGLSPSRSALAALLAALSVNLAFLSTKLITETLFATLLAAGILLYARYVTGHRWLDLVGSGVGLGLLALTRPIALYLPVLMAGHLLWRALRRREALAAPLLLIAASSLVILPWIARNYRSAGFAGLSTAAQHNLFLYNAATVLAAEKGITLDQARDTMQAEAYSRFGALDTTDEAGYWTRLASVAGRVYRQRPLRAALVQASGFAMTVLTPLSLQPLLSHCGASGLEEAPPHVMQNALRLLVSGRFGAAATLAWRGRIALLPPFALVLLTLASLHLLALLLGVLAALVRRRAGTTAWLLLPILYFTLLPGPVGEARFRAPIEPLLCVMAAAGLTALFDRAHNGNARRPQGRRATVA
jgi:4-amino-4-deoxy-L-arabinose transferase-like glycosyltransferase